MVSKKPLVIRTWENTRSTRFGRIASDAWLLLIFLTIVTALSTPHLKHSPAWRAQLAVISLFQAGFFLTMTVDLFVDMRRLNRDNRDIDVELKSLEKQLEEMKIRRIVLEVMREVVEEWDKAQKK